MVIKSNVMKKIILITICTFIGLTACEKKSTTHEIPLSESICGEWRGTGLSVDAGIYVDFNSDGTFELYQKLTDEEFELRRGTWKIAGNILSGSYNDGEPWACSYQATVSGNALTLVAQSEGSETNVYAKTEIPAYIKENCTIVVRSTAL